MSAEKGWDRVLHLNEPLRAETSYHLVKEDGFWKLFSISASKEIPKAIGGIYSTDPNADYEPMPNMTASQIALRYQRDDDTTPHDEMVWTFDQVVSAMQDAVRHYIAYRQSEKEGDQ